VIVQAPAADGSRLALTLDEHLRTADALHRAFGNGDFAIPPPADLFAHVVRHHDDGWAEEDAAPAVDPRTGLPVSLNDQPTARSLEIGRRSIERNLARHPWCGLLVSMHICGLYARRPGLTGRPEDDALDPRVQRFLAAEEARRRALLADFDADAVARSYRLLQFFDGLAVWLNLRAPDGDAVWTFPALPRRDGTPADLRVASAGRRLGVAPWPFAGDAVEVAFRGRRYVPAGRFHPADEVEQRLVLQPIV
jgi:hypothetical protein